jgi:hypothetical protein
MKNDLSVDIALSPELLAHLWAQSRQMKVPIQWLIAGLVCDTFDSTAVGTPGRNLEAAQAVA